MTWDDVGGLQDVKRMSTSPQARPAFGTVLADHMAVASFRNGRWSGHELQPTGPIEIHPAAHVLHYASTCFEGFKAYRWADGSVRVPAVLKPYMGGIDRISPP